MASKLQISLLSRLVTVLFAKGRLITSTNCLSANCFRFLFHALPYLSILKFLSVGRNV